ncbi:MAG: hypothetical protein EBW86_05260, partial [Rhodobacteraceae bacterium]|nr:hypothetical protein [Paracoccaceae bacterium]
MRPILYVEKFNDWSVREFDGAQFELEGKRYHGMITKLSEEGIMFRPFTINEERASGTDWSVQHPLMFVRITDFDNINLEIWDEHRGCDNSAIGVPGSFENWRHVWPEENISSNTINGSCWRFNIYL